MTIGPRRWQAASSRQGFTLFEVLLVVFIVMIVAVIAVPRFASSMEGARLRTSARSVAMAHRYTRATAVLQQKYMAIYFYTEQGKLEVVSLTAAGESEGEATFGQGGRSEAVTYNVSIDQERALAEGVRFADVDLENRDQQEKEAYWVNYYPNGTCDEYAIRLEDRTGKSMWIEIDPLSGKVEVEHE